MRKKRQKGRVEKRSLSKCNGVCRTFDILQSKYADILQDDPEVTEIRCNVPLEGTGIEEYTSDFVCTRTDGSSFVRECVYRTQLQRKKTIELLDASQRYWHAHAIYDWKLVIDAQKEP